MANRYKLATGNAGAGDSYYYAQLFRDSAKFETFVSLAEIHPGIFEADSAVNWEPGDDVVYYVGNDANARIIVAGTWDPEAYMRWNTK
jgi:hypothetical protein